MHERENALKEWVVQTINQQNFVLTPLAGDASFRRYFRLQYNSLTFVIMDAPLEKEEVHPFIRINHTLEQAQVLTPHILALDLEQGFLLLRDLGDRLLLNELNTNSVDNYYHQAIDTLFKIQTCTTNDPYLAIFDQAFMIKEMDLCSEWFLNAYLQLTLSVKENELLQSTMKWIADEIAQQPRTFVHRDYHSRNLMVTENGLGVIDFQDAVHGPLTYDLVSLLKDCYISWPRTKVLQWIEYFYKKNTLAQIYSLDEFIRAFDLCGLQRHLKVLGVFCRLYLRDGKAGYLKDLPLTLKYVLECTETYEKLHPLFDFFQKRVHLS